MLPHKTKRGQLALERLKSFDGVPPPYDTQKKVVVPSALRALCLKPRRKVRTYGPELWWFEEGEELLVGIVTSG